MNKAKEAVSEFLNHNNKHSVDIEQTTAPAVVHERIQAAKHEEITTAVDREIHQHHHQIHVQPIADKVIEPEQHHVNVVPVEHRQTHHGKDREVELALAEQQKQFRDEQEILATQTSRSQNTIVGEHVHHHIHDTIQPVIERERLQQHIVHTTIPVHERIDKEPVIHSGNVLPTKTLAEFEASGHSLTGGRTAPEHIDYEGEPLKIKDDSRVGFEHSTRHTGAGSVGAPGELGTTTGIVGAAGLTGHHHTPTPGPHSSSLENKLDPRVSSTGQTSGLGHTTSGTSHTTSGLTGSSPAGYGTTGAGTGLGSGTTGVSERAGHSTTDTNTTPSTADKLLSKIGINR